MNQKRATELLLSGAKLTNPVRKLCMKSRETSMVSRTPIYREDDQDEFGHKTVEYFSSKPLESTPEQRLALKLRRASLAQLNKWCDRAFRRNEVCGRLADKATGGKRINLLMFRAAKHAALFFGCTTEIDRRKQEIAMRAELKAENV